MKHFILAALLLSSHAFAQDDFLLRDSIDRSTRETQRLLKEQKETQRLLQEQIQLQKEAQQQKHKSINTSGCIPPGHLLIRIADGLIKSGDPEFFSQGVEIMARRCQY